MPEDKPVNNARNDHRLLAIYMVAIVIIGALGGGYVYHEQRNKAASLMRVNGSLAKQASQLSTQLAAAKAAGNVSTADWKSYCDPHGSFCFKYPPDWLLTAKYNSLEIDTTVLLTNPAKSVIVTYMDGYMHDDFDANFILHSINSLKAGNNNLAVVGGYYVSTVNRPPQYAVVNLGSRATDPSLSDTPGQNIFIGGAALFTYGNTGLGMFMANAIGTNFATSQQANAWFNSIDGKTAYQIIASLATK